GIAVHHLERIAALDDVDARQRAPGATDRIEGAAAAGLELWDTGNLAFDDTLGALQRPMRGILQSEAAQRQRDAAVHAVLADVDQFERTAAEVTDDTVGIVEAGDHAKRRQFRLARAGEDFDWCAADAFGLGNEIRAIGSVTTGGGRDCIDTADLLGPALRVISAQRAQGFRYRLGGQ